MEIRREELSKCFCECPEKWVVCESPDKPQPACPPRNSSWEGQDWNSCCPPAALVIPAGGRLALKSSLVLVSISAAAAFEAQNKGRQLNPPVAWPSNRADCTLFCVSGLRDGGAIRASTNSLLLIKHSIAQN